MQQSNDAKREEKINFAIGVVVFSVVIALVTVLAVFLIRVAHRNAGVSDVLPKPPEPLAKVTLTAPDVTITYGEELPEMPCEVSSDAECNAVGKVKDCKLEVGVYDIDVETDIDTSKYQTEIVGGKLTVLPKLLQVQAPFVKEYDGGCTIARPQIRLDGVLENDDVSAECDVLYFDNKNVGVGKTVLLSNVRLVGKDAANYILPDFAEGIVVPKIVRFEGLKVANKPYDGTTKATVEDLGTLYGVCEGDSIAIGNVTSHFERADVGKQKVTVEVTLVGADKDNYTVVPMTYNAEIQQKSSFWDKIFNKEPIAPTKVEG